MHKADEEGRFPVNVLAIGADSRSSEAICNFGAVAVQNRREPIVGRRR